MTSLGLLHNGAKLRLEALGAYAPGFCSTFTEFKFSKTSSFASGLWQQDYGKLHQGRRTEI